MLTEKFMVLIGFSLCQSIRMKGAARNGKSKAAYQHRGGDLGRIPLG
jgi:hypothetical protein